MLTNSHVFPADKVGELTNFRPQPPDDRTTAENTAAHFNLGIPSRTKKFKKISHGRKYVDIGTW